VLRGSSRSRSAAEMIRRGWRVLLLACKGRRARGVADVVTASYGRRLATSTSTAFLDQAEGER
jgi:hypothetical protein